MQMDAQYLRDCVSMLYKLMKIQALSKDKTQLQWEIQYTKMGDFKIMSKNFFNQFL